MSNQELERARAELKAIGADWALLSSLDNVTYVSHFAVPIDFGATATLTLVPPLALIGVSDSASNLIVSSGYESAAKGQSALDEVLVYESGFAFYPFSSRDNFLALLHETLSKAGLGSGMAKIAIEERTLPTLVLTLLQSEFPNVELIEAGAALTNARLIKTERELDLLRFAALVNKAGQDELLRQTREAGKNEFTMWSAVTEAMERRAGETLYVFGELVTGTRTRHVNYPGGPKNNLTSPGDLALMDMSPRVNGYWSDTTNTMVIGGVEPTEKQKRYGVAAREAFHAAAEMLRPGHQSREAFEAAKQTFAKYGLEIGHYAGHQIGTSVNEVPRLLPYDDTPIQVGMVFSIETGAYEGAQGDTGARMEKSVIVHADAPEILC
ncbi:MAG: Xaa-Pro peptidase family protein, partial [Chloroflexota bacterium]